MPNQSGRFVDMSKILLEERSRVPDKCQQHWYALAASFVDGLSVLDVGSGTGYGLEIIAAGGALRVVGIDPLPVSQTVVKASIEDYQDNSFDLVTAIDVIEHVEDDAAFLSNLVRVAHRYVFLSTPNWLEFHCTNPFHTREYTPAELKTLLSNMQYKCWVSDRKHNITLLDTLLDTERGINFGVLITKEDRAPTDQG